MKLQNKQKQALNQKQQSQPQKQVTGRTGEQLAKNLLLNKGLTFLCQNYRSKLGEIDLIFEDQGVLVFVEVKTRTRLEQGIPEEAVTPQKIATIERVASWYMNEFSLEDKKARIDVVAIEMINGKTEIRYHQDVTS